jgi:asparagine synthase (glutamine-hydrolysing)
VCGIAGEVRFDGLRSDAGLVRCMAKTLHHRGPDACGLWTSEHAVLAHQRLAIRDLSPAGAQPILSRDGQVVVSFNGEIYNDAELRVKLARDHGAIFRGGCDSEVIPAGYAAWGEALFERLEGMFAISLWDVRRQCLFLVRDGIGIKPLFYRWQDGRLLFGSELKAITAATGVPDTLDLLALHAFLAQGYVGPEATLVSGVRQVPPGSWLCFSREGVEKHRFWAPSRRGDIKDGEEAQTLFAELFPRVCRDMLVSDVPVGVLQSGGVDSSLISLTLNDPTIPLFTASFSHGDFDESAAARQVAEKIGAPWRTISADTEMDLEGDVRRVVWHFDGQLADSSGLAFYRLAREMRRHVTVALSGDGADEFFAGYPTYCASRLAERLAWVCEGGGLTGAAQLAFAAGGRSAGRYPIMQMLGRFLLGLNAGRYSHAEWRRYAMPWDCERLYAGEMRELLSIDPLGDYKGALSGEGGIMNRCLYADQIHYLPADMLMKADAMSMAHSLEIRVPFLDRRVMEFAGRLAPSLLGGNCCASPKAFLRDALVRLGGPRDVVRRKKTGFNVPVASLFRGELRVLAERLFEQRADAFSPYLNPQAVRLLWRRHRDGSADHGYLLWALLTLGVWWRQAV